MTFVVVGGGATGVETAGAIAELAKVALARDFRAINPAMSRIVLIEAGARVLPSFAASLSTAAKRALERKGVEVRLGQPVTRCDDEGVMLGEERMACGVTIWAAGVMASQAAQWLEAEHDRAGRVLVEQRFAFARTSGDFRHRRYRLGTQWGRQALARDRHGREAGREICRARLLARLSGKKTPPPFHYRDYGELATVGRNFAVVDFHWLRLTGRLAWFVWSVAHIYFLIGFRNRLVVAMDWIWAYLTFQRGARLITASDPDE